MYPAAAPGGAPRFVVPELRGQGGSERVSRVPRGVRVLAGLVLTGSAIVPFAVLPLASPAAADHTSAPTAVTIAGSFQDDLSVGCGDWQENCAATHLSYSPDDDVWQGTLTIPAGNWEYKATLNDAWSESYGRGAGNVTLNLAAQTTVKFYYDHKNHWVTDNQGDRIPVAVGDFQSELGCG